MIPRLKELYNKEIQMDLKNKLGLKNSYMAPKLVKVVLNMGLGVDGNDAKILKVCAKIRIESFSFNSFEMPSILLPEGPNTGILNLSTKVFIPPV